MAGRVQADCAALLAGPRWAVVGRETRRHSTLSLSTVCYEASHRHQFSSAGSTGTIKTPPANILSVSSVKSSYFRENVTQISDSQSWINRTNNFDYLLPEQQYDQSELILIGSWTTYKVTTETNPYDSVV